jgi:hypothetical protein
MLAFVLPNCPVRNTFIIRLLRQALPSSSDSDEILFTIAFVLVHKSAPIVLRESLTHFLVGNWGAVVYK